MEELSFLYATKLETDPENLNFFKEANLYLIAFVQKAFH